MSVESAAISALSAVVAGLCFLFKLLWQRSEACERWRNDKEPLLRDLSEKLGALNGAMTLFRQCKTPNCMFTGMNSETFSIKNLSEHEHESHAFLHTRSPR